MARIRSSVREADEPRVVPLRRQYLDIKARFPDTILLFRLGDFYETFEEDARIAAEALDIVLTSREMGKNQRVPMAGIPYHAAESYIARLIAAGHKVAICEQVGEVTKGRGLVDRDVTRVVTPGTVDDPAMLDARRNNYIAGVIVDGNRVGLAAADITTGEFLATEIGGRTLAEAMMTANRELLRLQPAEIVRPGGQTDDHLPVPESTWIPESAARSQTDAWRWREERAKELLCRHFTVSSLDGFGLGGLSVAIRAAGGLLHYLTETQLSGLKQINRIRTWSTDAFMTLDAQTRRNLELLESTRGDRRHSLIEVLDLTRTPMGARMLRSWLNQPLLQLDELKARQQDVRAFHQAALPRSELRTRLGRIGDIERLANRAITGAISPRELSQLGASLAVLPSLSGPIATMASPPSLPDLADVESLIRTALAEDPPAVVGRGQVIRSGFSAELDEHLRRVREARAFIAGLESSERERTGIRSLKVGYNKVFGYYLEISTAALAMAERERGSVLPADYIPKQSLTNATRYFTPQLKEYETIVLTAEETLHQLQTELFRRLVAQVASAAPRLLEAAQAIAYLDVVATLAEVAVLRNYVEPELTHDDAIEIVAGRHPTLEMVIPRGEYVPNDARFDDQQRIIILTGPNMAGKSSWLRQVALIVLLAQIGSFVPAERARIGLVDRIFTRIGAQDDIAGGQSTFMVEMVETAAILNHATNRSLVVLDEIGRGTSTYDGLAIAQAIVEFIHNTPSLRCKTLFATHYHELTQLESVLPYLRCSRMDVLEEGERVVFLHRVVAGGADRSYGIHVADLAGIPKPVVNRARSILDELERRGGGMPSPLVGRAGEGMYPPSRARESPAQLRFIEESSPVLDAIRDLDVDQITPVEAITRLYEIKRLADA
jgi:DNA mismatch repair protein MutS